MSPTIFPLIILGVFRQLEAARKLPNRCPREPKISTVTLCLWAFQRAPDQNLICSVTRILQMFNICSHIRAKADPTRPSGGVLASSREHPQPGICKMAVRRALGVIVSPRALPLNVGRCLQISEKEILPGPFGTTAEVDLRKVQSHECHTNGGREMRPQREKSGRQMCTSA